MYKEVDREKREKKSASANVGLNIFMTKAPIGPTSIRRLCMGSNIPAPSRSSMYTSAGKVCKEIERMNYIDMKSQRNVVKTVNKIRGMPENDIIVQADGVYNNSWFSGVGKTLCQPDTQCSYIVAENVTPIKQVITPENKLCSKHVFHSSEDGQCNIMFDSCISTVPMENTIRNEKEWAKICFLDLKLGHLEPNYDTKVPDSNAYRAATDLYTNKVTKSFPQYQIDTRHLGENQIRYIKRRPAVLKMMPGLTTN